MAGEVWDQALHVRRTWPERDSQLDVNSLLKRGCLMAIDIANNNARIAAIWVLLNEAEATSGFNSTETEATTFLL
jgi:hypothetical protein